MKYLVFLAILLGISTSFMLSTEIHTSVSQTLKYSSEAKRKTQDDSTFKVQQAEVGAVEGSVGRVLEEKSKEYLMDASTAVFLVIVAAIMLFIYQLAKSPTRKRVSRRIEKF